jgi:MFS family permease
MCLPLIVYSEKQRKTKQIYLVSVSSLLVALFFMFFQSNYIMFALGLLFFFFGFTFLEATLPSLVAKYSPLLNKGTSMGLYSTCQFLGAALGSYINGLLLKNYGHDGLLIICSIIILVWLLLVIRMQQLQSIKSVVTVINKSTPTSIFEYLTKIRKVSGVIEAIVLPNNCKVCIKYDTEKLDNKNLECLGIVI